MNLWLLFELNKPTKWARIPIRGAMASPFSYSLSCTTTTITRVKNLYSISTIWALSMLTGNSLAQWASQVNREDEEYEHQVH